MKKITVAIFALVSFSIAHAQENTFLFYSMKGNVSVVENKVESKAKIGKMISGTTTIKLSSGAMATLICNEQSMFTLTKPGVYTLAQLKDSCNSTTANVSANYVRYVWNQMTKSSGSPGSNRKLYMNTVGAVSRSVNNIWIDPRLDTVNYSGGDFPLSWKSYAEANEFDFFVYDPANPNTPIFQTTVKKLKIAIPAFAAKLKAGHTYEWTSAVKGEQNNEKKILNYVTKETFNKVLENINANTGTFENAAEQAYRIGFMLEDMHYLSEAYQYYSKAATLAPDVPLYRATLMSFKKDYEIK